jgi:hypothetical protein
MAFHCSKCQKSISSKSYLKKHEEKCNGLQSNQCELCHKNFKCIDSKYRHKKNKVCERNGTMIINDHSQTTNTNHILSHNNITINGGINITIPFLTEKLELTETVKKLFLDNTNDFLMYIMSEILRENYFNPMKPEQQNIKKTIKGDKFMEFFKDGEWKFTPSSVVIKNFLNKLNKLIEQYIPSKIGEFREAEFDDHKRKSYLATKQRVAFLNNIQPYITMIKVILNQKICQKYTSRDDQEKYEWSEDKYMTYFDEILYKLTQQLQCHTF